MLDFTGTSLSVCFGIKSKIAPDLISTTLAVWLTTLILGHTRTFAEGIATNKTVKNNPILIKRSIVTDSLLGDRLLIFFNTVEIT